MKRDELHQRIVLFVIKLTVTIMNTVTLIKKHNPTAINLIDIYTEKQ